MTPFQIVDDVVKRLEAAGIPYAIGGSFASSAWGQMRFTHDADIAVMVSNAMVDALIEAFPDPYLLSRQELQRGLDEAREFRSAQLMHMDEVFKIDLFLLHDRPYERTEIERARRTEHSPGLFAQFCAPENIVIAKLRWFVLGNRVSDRQWNDIVQVLEMQEGRLDEAYLDRWAAHFGVDDLLNEARAQIPP